MKADLRPLFHPSSVAIVGASADLSKSGGRFWQGLRALEYQGAAYPVNTSENALPGEKVYRQVSDIPGEVDLAILAVPARAVRSSIADCARKGVKVAIIHGAGFAELGEEGRAEQEAVVAVARAAGMRLVGPNCMGITCPSARINTVAGSGTLRFEPGNLGFIGQSGWTTEYALIMGSARGLSFSAAVSSGNQADLTMTDYLEYFAGDPQTKVIGAYAEGFKDGRSFLATAREAARQKPVVIWKSGRTPTGVRSVQSHTGSLAGNDAITQAALRQAGVEEATGVEDLLDAMAGFTSPLLPEGRRVGVIVDTGGAGVAASDACESMGLEVPRLTDQVQRALRDHLKAYLPPFAGIANPVDLVWAPAGMEDEVYGRSVELIAPEVDALLIMLYPSGDHEKLASWLASLRDRVGKPIFVVPPYGSVMQPYMRLCTQHRVPAFESMERAVRALTRLVRRTELLRANPVT